MLPQGDHGTGKTGNLDGNFSRQGKQGNLVNIILTQGKLWQYRENCILVVESLTCNVIRGFA